MKCGTVGKVIVSYVRKISPNRLSAHLESYVHVRHCMLSLLRSYKLMMLCKEIAYEISILSCEVFNSAMNNNAKEVQLLNKGLCRNQHREKSWQEVFHTYGILSSVSVHERRNLMQERTRLLSNPLKNM